MGLTTVKNDSGNNGDWQRSGLAWREWYWELLLLPQLSLLLLLLHRWPLLPPAAAARCRGAHRAAGGYPVYCRGLRGYSHQGQDLGHRHQRRRSHDNNHQSHQQHAGELQGSVPALCWDPRAWGAVRLLHFNLGSDGVVGMFTHTHTHVAIIGCMPRYIMI